jgi:CxxC motif-containing protein (DUF1111 family)
VQRGVAFALTLEGIGAAIEEEPDRVVITGGLQRSSAMKAENVSMAVKKEDRNADGVAGRTSDISALLRPAKAYGRAEWNLLPPVLMFH